MAAPPGQPPAAAPGPHPMHAPGPVVGSGQAFLHTMELCLGPAVFMCLMSFAVFCRKPSQVSEHRDTAAGCCGDTIVPLGGWVRPSTSDGPIDRSIEG